MSRIERIAVMGAGNGGCAAAVDLGLRGFEVRLWSRDPATTAPLQVRGGIAYEGVFGEGYARIASITNDAGAAVNGADAVVILAPAQAHESIVKLVAPHLAREQLLLAAPGQTLTLIPRTLRECGYASPVCGLLSTLPYICRKIAPDRVRISRASARLRFAAFPGSRTGELAERTRPLFPAIDPVANVLDTLFRYTNAIHHPPAFLCNVGRIESGAEYCHYYEGITPSVGKLIDQLDGERVAIAPAFGCAVDTLPEHFYQMGYTDEHGRTGGSAYHVFHHSEPNRWIKAPTTIDHRFFNEDIPFGLVPFSELAQLAAVPAPVTDAVIAVASAITGKDYRASGLNRVRMGVEGMAARDILKLVETGY